MSHAAIVRSVATLFALACAPLAVAQELVPKAPPNAIELTAQDYAEIEQLAIRYAWLLDRCVNGGYDYADLYVADGQFSVAESFGTTSNEQRRFVTRGREALARAAGGDGKGACVDPKTTLGYGLTHIVTNHMIVATKDGAIGMVMWRQDGKELYFMTRNWEVMAVDVETTPTFKAGTPRMLFSLPGPLPGNPMQWKNVSHDGQRFIFAMPVTAPGPGR